MSTDPRDRTVLVKMNGAVIARYDRAGKFYYEPSEGRRRHIKMAEAVQFALLPGSTWVEGMPGGMRFDAEVRKAKRAKVRL